MINCKNKMNTTENQICEKNNDDNNNKNNDNNNNINNDNDGNKNNDHNNNDDESVPKIKCKKYSKNIPPPQYIPKNALLESGIETSVFRMSNEEKYKKDKFDEENSGEGNSCEEHSDAEDSDDDGDCTEDDDESENESENDENKDDYNDYVPIISEEEKNYLILNSKNKTDNDDNDNNNDNNNNNNSDKYSWKNDNKINEFTLPNDLPNYYEWRDVFPQLQVGINIFDRI